MAIDCNGKEQVKCTDPNTHIWNLVEMVMHAKGAMGSGANPQILSYCGPSTAMVGMMFQLHGVQNDSGQVYMAPSQRGQITFTT